MYKRDIINFIFITSFSVFGIGKYVSGSINPSLGLIVSIAPYFLIILFYLIDLLYKREFQIQLNSNYWLMLAFLLSTVISVFVSFKRNLPNLDLQLVILRSIMVMIPFQASIIVFLYNRHKNNLFRLTFVGLSGLLLINVFGYYGLGLSNGVHNIEGRINFPFLEALYSGAGLIAILNLMIVYVLIKSWNYPIKFFYLSVYLLINMFFLFYINSRLVMIMFILIMVIYMLRLGGKFTYLYLLSFFTLPILLNTGRLLYDILSLPVFTSILQRVDLFDVMTFNGRSLLWENVFDWMWLDQRGLFLGNGFEGHYFLGIQYDVAQLFGIKELYNLHLHSAVLEVIVNQGLLGALLIFALFYKMSRHYKKRFDQRADDGAFYYVMLFMLFLFHVDMLQFMDNLGSIIFSLLAARIVVKQYDAIPNEKSAREVVSTDHRNVNQMSWYS